MTTKRGVSDIEIRENPDSLIFVEGILIGVDTSAAVGAHDEAPLVLGIQQDTCHGPSAVRMVPKLQVSNVEIVV